MRNKLFSILYICLVAISACEKDVENIKAPYFQQKLVITSFISPSDTISSIFVSSNSDIYNELDTLESLGNLSATISNGISEIDLTPVEGGFIFKPKDMPIEEGKTYTLKVRNDKGLSAEASCTVPYARNFSLEADTTRDLKTDSYLGNYYQIRSEIYLTDSPGEKNYFRFICKERDFDSSYFYNPSILRILGTKFELFTDQEKDGEKIFVNSIIVTDPVNSDSAFLTFYLLNTDRDYYNYHKTLYEYISGNYFGEISRVYSNVNDGLGIFASYTVDSLVLRLK
ncbi:MAG: DUF4249 domain-containing protein [Bacteroidia bacterium]|nr:DUF4249 domain-containing protein [Bacteroidia bacterium]